MKGVVRYDHPKTGHGWLARTQWRGKFKRRRFADNTWGSQKAARGAAMLWLISVDEEAKKPRTKRWLRSSGGWGRAGKRGKWKRR